MSANNPPRQDATPSRLLWLLLAVCALIGTVARLARVDLIEFRHDSAYWALEASRVLAGGYLPLIGQQVGSVSVPLYNGPFMTYATAVVLGLTGGPPTAMAAFIALCNVAAIGLAYLLGARLYSRSVGVVAAALFAVSPWLSLYGRMLWPQSFFPFLIPVNALLLLDHVNRRRPLSLLLSGVLLGICVQLHLSALALVGVSGLIALVYSKQRWSLALFVIGLLIGYVPILIYDAQHSWVNLGALGQLSSLHADGESRATHLAKLAWNFSNVLSGQGLWISKLGKTPFLPAVIEWGQGALFSGAFVVALLAFALGRKRNGRALAEVLPLQDALVLLFTLAPVAYFAVSRSTIQRHYFIFLYPLPFILLARGAQIVCQQLAARVSPQWVRRFALAGFALALSLNIVTLGAAGAYLAAQRGRSEYGTVWADKHAAVQSVLRDSGGAFDVDLSAVQEPLPYLYLLREAAAGAVTASPDDLYAPRIATAAAADRRYRIIEAEYHADAAALSRIIFQAPGIVVEARE